ncbi:alpha/beta hydrolase [Monashia sp. NPDC004114]
MTISVGAIRSSRPEQLSATSRRLEEQREQVRQIIQTVLLGGRQERRWSGLASTAATNRSALVVGRLAGLAASIGASGQALSHAALRLAAAAELVHQADRRAAAAGAWVDHDGQIFLPVRGTSGDPVLDAHVAREDELMRAEVMAALAEAVRVAALTDLELALGLLAAALESPASTPRTRQTPRTQGGPNGASVMSGTGVLSVVPPPPPGRDARSVYASSAWWRSLTDEESGRVIADHPQWVGPRDGIPASDRHAANLVLLARAERDAQDGARRAEGAPLWDGSERTRAHDRLEDLRAIREVLSRRDGVQRRLLLVDATDTNVKVVVALGDPDRARHVVTYVGGLSTTARGDLRRYDDDLERLRAQALTVARGDDVAAVTWMGYNAPQVSEIVTSIDRNVLNAKLARDNADALADFVTGLDAARDRPAHQVVWAHSYDAVLAGFAVLRTSAIDDVAIFGAPGLPFSSVAETGLKPGALNVLHAIGDDVADYGWIVHGTKAADVLGATRLSTFALKKPGSGCNHWLRPRSDFVDLRRTAVGHSDYMRDGTDSARNLVAVLAGRPDLLSPESSDERACTTIGPGSGPFDPMRWPVLVPER